MIAGDGNGQIGLREIATGKFRRLTEPAPGPAEPYWVDGTFSPDGRQIAYLWFSDANANDDDGETPDCQHGGGSADSSEDPLCQFRGRSLSPPRTGQPDGTWIAVRVKEERTRQRRSASSTSKVARFASPENRLNGLDHRRSRFSPDSRFLTYKTGHQAKDQIES